MPCMSNFLGIHALLKARCHLQFIVPATRRFVIQLQTGGIVSKTFQDESRLLILTVFSSCITQCTFLYIKIRAKFHFVPIEWRRSLFDGSS
jgi:hypothetical protein